MCIKRKKEKQSFRNLVEYVPYYNVPIRRAKGTILSNAMLEEFCKKRFSTEETHSLKITSKHFEEVLSGRKTFEIRKNDRDFKVGDVVKLNEYLGKSDANEDVYSGRFVRVFITYIYDLEDVLPGYIAFDFVFMQRFV